MEKIKPNLKILLISTFVFLSLFLLPSTTRAEKPLHWEEPVNTGNFAYLKVEADSYPRICDVLNSSVCTSTSKNILKNGDYIGVFYYDANNVLKCAGYGVWNSTGLLFGFFGDDPYTPLKDGFNYNEAIKIKVFSQKTQKDYIVNTGDVTYGSCTGCNPLGKFNGLGIHKVTNLIAKIAAGNFDAYALHDSEMTTPSVCENSNAPVFTAVDPIVSSNSFAPVTANTTMYQWSNTGNGSTWYPTTPSLENNVLSNFDFIGVVNNVNDGISKYFMKATNGSRTSLAYPLLFKVYNEPSVSTIDTFSNINLTSVTSGGNVSSDGGDSVTERGVVWDTSTSPTIDLITKTSDGSGVGLFTSDITGLTSNTTYHIRAYAKNGCSNVAYGEEYDFTTPAESTPTYTIMASAGSNGIVAPASLTVVSGSNASFLVTADNLYNISDTVGGDCPTGSWSGNKYTIGSVIVGCSVSFSFINSQNYTVTYSGFNNDYGEVPVDSNIYHPGDSFTVLGNTGFLSRIGYTFNTWMDSNQVPRDPGSTWPINSNKELFANWTASTYQVAFDPNGGSGSMSNMNFTYGVSQDLTANSFTKDGYIFISWNTSSDGTGTSYTDGQSVSDLTYGYNNAVVTLYAQWVLDIPYTVTYDGNSSTGGSVPIDGLTYTVGTSVTVLGSGTLVKTGHTFNGWNTVDNGSGTHYDANDVFMIIANITLYAEWTPNIYTISYNGNGNSGGNVPSSQPKTYGIDLTLRNNTGNLSKTVSIGVFYNMRSRFPRGLPRCPCRKV